MFTWHRTVDYRRRLKLTELQVFDGLVLVFLPHACIFLKLNCILFRSLYSRNAVFVEVLFSFQNDFYALLNKVMSIINDIDLLYRGGKASSYVERCHAIELQCFSFQTFPCSFSFPIMRHINLNCI